MAFSGSFPVKIIDFGVIAQAHIVEVTDAFKGADYVRVKADFVRSFTDVGRGVDRYSKVASFHVELKDGGKACERLEKFVAFYRSFVDSGESVDRFRKTALKRFEDSGRVTDRYGKIISFNRSFIDSGKSIETFEKTVSCIRSFTDSGKIVDWYSKTATFIRDLYDIGVFCDFLTRGILRSFFDWAVGEHMPAVSFGKWFVETIKTLDYIRRDLGKVHVDAYGVEDYVSKDALRGVRDLGAVMDRYGKSVDRVFVETGVVCDYVSRDALRSFVDACAVMDWYGKGVVRVLVDAGVVSETIARDFYKRFEFESPSIGWVKASLGKWFLDSVKVSDVMVKDVEKIPIETVFVSDALRKAIYKQFEFEAPSTGYVRVGVGKRLEDSVSVSDYMCRDLAKAFIEFVVARDAPYRIITLTLRDLVFGEYTSIKGMTKRVVEPPITIVELKFMKELIKPFAESIGVVEVFRKEIIKKLIERVFGEHIPVKGITKKIVEPPLSIIELKFIKELLKYFAETITVTEVLRKELAKIFVERVYQEYWATKGMLSSFIDTSRMKDLLTKVAYKICGFDVRRVYALPREWADIIEDTDHNVKIEICKALLEAMKRVKDKLEA